MRERERERERERNLSRQLMAKSNIKQYCVSVMRWKIAMLYDNAMSAYFNENEKKKLFFLSILLYS
jgi:hypothetical protein